MCKLVHNMPCYTTPYSSTAKVHSGRWGNGVSLVNSELFQSWLPNAGVD